MIRLIIALLIVNISHAAVMNDTVEIKGKVVKFNTELVYLKYKKKRFSIPRKYVQQKQLKETGYITVYLSYKDYKKSSDKIIKDKEDSIKNSFYYKRRKRKLQ